MSASRMPSLGVVRSFQMPRSFGSMTVLDNLLVPAVGSHRPRFRRTGQRDLAMTILNDLGLSAYANSAASGLWRPDHASAGRPGAHVRAGEASTPG